MTDSILKEKICGNKKLFTTWQPSSVMAQSYISSILSGEPVNTHKVFHNGAVGVSNQLKTLAEIALEQKYRTGFFSGGLPVLNKFGISQGYENLFVLKPHKFLKKNSNTARLFSEAGEWVQRDVGNENSFLTLFLPNKSLYLPVGLLEPNSLLVEIEKFIGVMEKASREINFLIVGVPGVKGREQSIKNIDTMHFGPFSIYFFNRQVKNNMKKSFILIRNFRDLFQFIKLLLVEDLKEFPERKKIKNNLVALPSHALKILDNQKINNFLNFWQDSEGSHSAIEIEINKYGLQRLPSWTFGWLEQEYFTIRNWQKILDLGQKVSNQNILFIAKRNLKKDVESQSDCLEYFQNVDKKIDDFYSVCQDASLLKIIEGLRNIKKTKTPSQTFLAEINKINNRRVAKNTNLKMLFVNDIFEPFDFSISLSELYFFLPENLPYLKYLKPFNRE